MNKNIVLVGNPNSGKTTLFNNLTKMKQKVGNWTGVTVEKKEGFYSKNKKVKILDLPGIYSLTPYSLEEKVARSYILDENPDLIINIIDATNLERNLYLTMQLLETNSNMIVALNMEDELKKNGIKINIDKLEKLLGCPIVSISALKNKNITKLMDLAINHEKTQLNPMEFSEDIEVKLSKIQASLNTENDRFYSIKLFEKDNIYIKKFKDSISKDEVDSIVGDENSTESISIERYAYIEKCIKDFEEKTVSKAKVVSNKIDSIVTNRWLGFPVFAFIIFIMYLVSVTLIDKLGVPTFVSETIFGGIGDVVGKFLAKIGGQSWLIALVVDGIIAGIGGVLSFLPQILVLFMFIALLEGCGYMARVAMIMDKVFKRIGLSGKSFIPMIIGTGCSVPGIMCARTIKNTDERRMTIMLTPFVPCGAKLPVFALFAGALFPNNPFVAPSMYFLGICMVIIGGLILKRLKLFKSDSDSFVLELPQYRVPKVKNVLMQIWEKAKSFFVKAGTVIFVASIVIWFTQSFSWTFKMVENPADSILASIGKLIAPIFTPLGFGNWQSSVAVLTSVGAKEIVVSTFAILFKVGEETPELGMQISQFFTPQAGYAFMVFILLSAPCVAAMSATKRELGSWKWFGITFAFQMGMGYTVALIVNQLGNLYVANKGLFVSLVILAFILICAVLAIIYQRRRKKKNGCSGGCSSCCSSCKNVNEDLIDQNKTIKS